MTDQPDFQADDLPLTDEMIVSYLEKNPAFFNRNPQLLTSIKFTDPQRGVVSLVERQQLQLRHQVHSLEEEVTQLITVANHNEKLFAVYSELYLLLLDCNNAHELLDSLFQATTELLALSNVKLWLNSSLDFIHPSLVINDCLGVMKNRLSKDDYYFGRLQQSETALIFAQQPVGSVVLVKLVHQGQELGFLAISSDDAEHFDPRMDTLLLSQFRTLVAKLLHQHLVL